MSVVPDDDILVLEAKTRATFFGLKFVVDLNSSDIMIKSDLLVLVKLLKAVSKFFHILGSIYEDI